MKRVEVMGRGSLKGFLLFGLLLLVTTPNRVGVAKEVSVPGETDPSVPPLIPVDLRWGPQLFVDDFLIAESRNLTRTTSQPRRFEGNPILGHEEGTTQPYVSVIRDPQTGKFRLWYDRDRGVDSAVAYAESNDGIAWETPNLGILGDSNKVMSISEPFQSGYGASVLDDGPNASDPDKRFKLVWWGQAKDWPEGDPGFRVAFSPDGLHWTKYPGNPVLPDFSEAPPHDVNDRRRAYGVGDIIDVYWDPIRNRYGALIKTPATPADGYEMGPKARSYIRRLVSGSISNDFTSWLRPWRVIVPEDRDEGILEFYGVGGIVSRGSLLVGFVRILRDDLPYNPGEPAEGIGYTTLVTSREGLVWERHDDVFMDRGEEPDAWDRAVTWVGSCLEVGDRLYLYYGGYKRGHKIEPEKERQIGLALLPKDRFVSRDSADEGFLRTVPCYLHDGRGRKLALNVNAGGGVVRVQLKDSRGEVFPGYSFEDCVPIRTDGFSEAVLWEKKGGQLSAELSDLFAETLIVEFQIEKARLYGFDILQ